MRILVDATAVGEGGGGICTFLVGLLSGWSEAGFDDEWQIIGMDDLPQAVDGLVAHRGIVRRGASPSVARRVLTQQLVLPLISRRRSWIPDVLLATTPVIPVMPSRIPTVAVVYDLRFLMFPNEFQRVARTYRKVAYTHGLRHADGLIAISEFTCHEVQDAIKPRRPAAPQVVHLGADHVDQWPSVKMDQGHAIVFAHWSNKRPEVAIQAWALLRARHPGFSSQLNVVGTPSSEVTVLTRLASELGVADLVTIHPFLAEDEYRTLFASSSVVLVPSTTEGFGLPVVEAQRLGIPVVASAVGSVSEVGGDGVRYSGDGSASSFAAMCGDVLFDRHLREELIGRGRINASRFSWRSTAELTRREMERCLNGPSIDRGWVHRS
jgi:glycosyltransferase involved in cell wall biosynthesis